MDNQTSNQQNNPAPKTKREDGRVKHARKNALKGMGLWPESMSFPKELLDRPLFDLIVDDSRQGS